MENHTLHPLLGRLSLDAIPYHEPILVATFTMVVLVGSNLAWCHPILFQRLTRAKEARPRPAPCRHRPAPHRHGRGR